MKTRPPLLTRGGPRATVGSRIEHPQNRAIPLSVQVQADGHRSTNSPAAGKTWHIQEQGRATGACPSARGQRERDGLGFESPDRSPRFGLLAAVLGSSPMFLAPSRGEVRFMNESLPMGRFAREEEPG